MTSGGMQSTSDACRGASRPQKHRAVVRAASRRAYTLHGDEPGRILDETPSSPVSGATVELLNRDLERRATVISDESGHVRLAPDPLAPMGLDGFEVAVEAGAEEQLDILGLAPLRWAQVKIPTNRAVQLMPHELEAVAVLRPSEATMFFGTQGVDGAVMFWSRTGR